MLLEILKTVFGVLYPLYGDRRRLRLTVHRAFFSNTNRECYFVNATNLSKSRDVEITHVWFEGKRQVPILQVDRPLPKRLKPDETWETWIEVERLTPDVLANVFILARARLSTGSIIKSKKNEDVPSTGTVPGGPIHG